MKCRKHTLFLLGFGLLLMVGAARLGYTSALFTDSAVIPANTFTTGTDAAAPTTSSSVILNAFGHAGYLKQGGSYQVCANITDTGAPASGVYSATANLAVTGSIISSGQTAATLSSGSFTCNGASYNYQSGTLTADNPLSEGSKTYQVTATDRWHNLANTNWSVTVDNTAPTATAFSTINNVNPAGRAKPNDAMTFTYSESTLDLGSIKPAWNGTSTAITVTFNNNALGGNDSITFDVNLGTVNLGAADYVSANTIFNATMVWNGATRVITVTLGTVVGTDSTSAGSVSTATYIPSSAIRDLAGNAINTASQPTESGKKHF